VASARLLLSGSEQPKGSKMANVVWSPQEGWHDGPSVKVTTCDECGAPITLDTVDPDGVLIGAECDACGYYVTRYMPGQAPDSDVLGSCGCRDYHMADCPVVTG